MMKEKIKLVVPYSGIIAILIALLIVHIGNIEAFFLLQRLLLAVFGYVAAVNDIKTKRIANALILAMLAAWVITVVPRIFIDIEGALAILRVAVAGFAAGGGLFLLVYIVSRKGVGGGDVKFMAIVGLYLGFNGVLAAMLYGTILAGVFGITLILLKKLDRKGTIPLVPFLYIGILIVLFFL